MHPLHPRWICMWSTWLPSILPVFKSIIALVWPNEWYFLSLSYIFCGIHHLVTGTHHGHHPFPPRSLPILNHPFCLLTYLPITSIASWEGHSLVMTIKTIFHNLKMDLFTMKLVKTPIHPHSHPSVPPVYPVHPRRICVWSVWLPSESPSFCQ